MLTGKQKSFLRSMANTLDPIFQVGKGGLNDNMIIQINEALETRELIKINVLNSSIADPNEISKEIAEKTNSEIVQVLGKKITLFKSSTEKPRINLP